MSQTHIKGLKARKVQELEVFPCVRGVFTGIWQGTHAAMKGVESRKKALILGPLATVGRSTEKYCLGICHLQSKSRTSTLLPLMLGRFSDSGTVEWKILLLTHKQHSGNISVGTESEPLLAACLSEPFS